MAVQDIWVGPEFVEVYPISTRELISMAELDSEAYPLEDSTEPYQTTDNNITILFLADDPNIPTPGENDYEMGTFHLVFWDDAAPGIVEKSLLSDGRYDLYQTLVFYDLSGLPQRQFARVELVMALYSNTDDDDDGRSLAVEYWDQHHVFEEGVGELTSPEDFSSHAPGSSVIPALPLAEIIENTDAATGTRNRFPDLYDPDGELIPTRYALPLRDDGKRSGLRGIRFSITGGQPSGVNHVVMDMHGPSSWPVTDSDFRSFMSTYPALRLWYGGVEAAADVTLGLTLEARVENPLRRITEHQARQRRGW